MRRTHFRAKAWRAIDAAVPAVGGVLFVVPLLIWPLATYAVVGVLLVAAFLFIALPEIVQSRRSRRRRELGCCGECGADLRDVPWRSEGAYDLLRCPVCSCIFHMQQVRFRSQTVEADLPPAGEQE